MSDDEEGKKKNDEVDPIRVSTLVTAKGKRFLVIDENKMYFVNKHSAKKVATHNNFTFMEM